MRPSPYQTAGIDSRKTHPEMVRNDAGGYVFPIDPWEYLDRVLFCGTDNGTYYVDAATLTERAFEGVHQLFVTGYGGQVLSRIDNLLGANRLPKIDPALFALAIGASVDTVTIWKNDIASTQPHLYPIQIRQEALNIALRHCHTPTHLMQFLSYLIPRRGWGRAVKRFVKQWFENLSPEKLALYSIKYNKRHGWSLRDLIRCSHIKFNVVLQKPHFYRGTPSLDGLTTETAKRALVLKWILERDKVLAGERAEIHGKYGCKRPAWLTQCLGIFPLLHAWLRCQVDPLIDIERIERYALPRESLPTRWLRYPSTWEALLPHMPMMAMMRNLGVMSARGLLTGDDDALATIYGRLLNSELIEKARLHPLFILKALLQYNRGHGEKGALRWPVIPAITQALTTAFDYALPQARLFTKRILVAWDMSGSMTDVSSMAAPLAYLFRQRGGLKVRHISFNTESAHLNIEKFASLAEAEAVYRGMCGGGTDCSQPFQTALRLLETYPSREPPELKNADILDAIIVITDHETWAGNSSAQPFLRQYKAHYNPSLKTVCIGLNATKGSIVDPKDPNTLGIAGFDPLTWDILHSFIEENSVYERTSDEN